MEIVVGLPRSLSGGEGPSAARVREFAGALARRVVPVPIRLCDERLTTVAAENVLREQGRKGQKRRAVVDQAAAVHHPAAGTGHRAQHGGCARRDRRGGR